MRKLKLHLKTLQQLKTQQELFIFLEDVIDTAVEKEATKINITIQSTETADHLEERDSGVDTTEKDHQVFKETETRDDMKILPIEDLIPTRTEEEI